MFTINQIGPFGNRISWRNDQKQRLVIEHFYNQLPEIFEAIILSGTPEQSNAPNIGAVTQADIQEVNDNRYYFVRIRPLETTDLVIPNPFFAANLNDAKRLINMHPLAYIEVNKTVHPPTHGDVYRCKLARKNKIGFVLLERLRNSGFKIGKVANRNLHKAYNNMSPMLMGGRPGETPRDVALGQGWLPGTTMVPCFGRDIPCSELVNFGRDTPVDYFAYTKNPAPSQATDDLFWSMVCQKLGTNSTPNKIRFFNAWGAKESSQSTNNPFATSHPGSGNTWSADPNMTAYNWSKPSKGYSRAWVRNYSTMDIGAKATAATIKSKKGKRYKNILAKLSESNPEFPESWFKQQAVKDEFETWGGKKEDGVGYWKGVMDGYNSGRRRRKPINTNQPGGRAGKCVKK